MEASPNSAGASSGSVQALAILKRAIFGAILGLVFGWVTDYRYVGLVAYAPAPGVLGLPLWALLQYTVVGMAIAVALMFVEPGLPKHPRTDTTALLADLAGFLLLYYLPVWGGPWGPTLMAIILLARLTCFGVKPDILLAPLGAVPGTLGEWTWTQMGYYHYLDPGTWTTVPLWLFLIWAYITVLSRRICLLLPGR